VNILINGRENYSSYCAYVFRNKIKDDLFSFAFRIRCRFDDFHNRNSMSDFSSFLDWMIYTLYE